MRLVTLHVVLVISLLSMAMVACRPTPASPATPPKAAVKKVGNVLAPGEVSVALPLRDGNLLVASRDDNTYRIFDPLSGQLVRQFSVEPPTQFTFVAPRHENRAAALTGGQGYMLVANFLNRAVSVIDVDSQRAVASIYTAGSPYKFQPENAGTGLVPVVHQRGVTVLDLSRLEERETFDAEDLVYSPDGSTAYLLEGPETTGGDPRVKIRSSGGQERHVDLGSVERYDGGGLAISPDDRRLYVLLAAARVMVVETSSGSVIKSIPVSKSPPVQFLRLSPEGEALVLWAREIAGLRGKDRLPGKVFLVNTTALDTPTLGVAQVEGPLAPVNITFSLDGRYLYVPDGDRGVWVFWR
ncbi:MAG: hypothetical protein HYY01_04085 [Chloroflexi bacterium]|nr:hypothetical protein [Chloroflexota bacterium]